MNTSAEPELPQPRIVSRERASPAMWELEIHGGHREAVSRPRTMTELPAWVCVWSSCRRIQASPLVSDSAQERKQSIQKHNDHCTISPTPLDRVRARLRISARDDLGTPLRAICPWLQPSRLEQLQRFLSGTWSRGRGSDARCTRNFQSRRWGRWVPDCWNQPLHFFEFFSAGSANW